MGSCLLLAILPIEEAFVPVVLFVFFLVPILGYVLDAPHVCRSLQCKPYQPKVLESSQ